MKSFEYHRPTTVADAVALLGKLDDAKALAGGQSLIPVLKLDLAQPSHLISLAGIRELREIRVDGDRVIVGALCTHDQVNRSAEVQQKIPGLAALAGGIGDAQVRNRGTLGGSVAHADPAADYPAAVLALGATIATDRRKILADDYFKGLFQTALEPGELVVAVHFPVPQSSAYAKFAHRASKYAVAGVMVARTAGGVRVAVTGAGTYAFRVPAMEAALGKKFAPESLDGITIPHDDLAGDGEASAEYRAHLVGVMARRAVAAQL